MANRLSVNEGRINTVPFNPKYEDVCLYKSLAVKEWTEMGRCRLKGKKEDLDAEDMRLLAHIRAAVRLLNTLGAIKPEWLRRENLKEDYPDVIPQELMKTNADEG